MSKLLTESVYAKTPNVSSYITLSTLPNAPSVYVPYHHTLYTSTVSPLLHVIVYGYNPSLSPIRLIGKWVTYRELGDISVNGCIEGSYVRGLVKGLVRGLL